MTYYDRSGKPLTAQEYMDLLGAGTEKDADNLKRVAQADYGRFWLSTVWLGIDHSLHGNPPIIFESMVFGTEGSEDGWDEACWRYSTEAEAKAGHDAILRVLVNGGSPDEVPL